MAESVEVVRGQEATIGCKVTGLTKALDKVIWVKAAAEGTPLTVDDAGDGTYKTSGIAFDEKTNTQTVKLTVKGSPTAADEAFKCKLQSDEWGYGAGSEYADTTVNLKIFGKLDRHLYHRRFALISHFTVTQNGQI